jgi:prepilin-type N-terminal cleavage/methylation domain-containing protein
MPVTFTPRKAFTLIELLIVVAIIAILAAIAVPNFLEAQTRAKVSRAKADIRSLVVGVESYFVDNNNYPEGTDNPNNYPEMITAYLQPLGLANGYYTFRSRGTNKLVGRDFANVTTPIAYITTVPTDPFAQQAAGFLTYCYRNAKAMKNGYVITSFGPDVDMLQSQGRPGVGTLNAANPFSTFRDSGAVARLGDVNERDVIHWYENTLPGLRESIDAFGGFNAALTDLSYDPSNGTISDGDIVFASPGPGFAAK